MKHITLSVKIVADSEMESDYAIGSTWVLSLHLYRWEQRMFNGSSERDQYIRAC